MFFSSKGVKRIFNTKNMRAPLYRAAMHAIILCCVYGVNEYFMANNRDGVLKFI